VARQNEVAEGRYRSVVDAATDAILLADIALTVVYANLAASELFGRESQVEGTAVSDLVIPEQAARVSDCARRAAVGVSQQFEATVMRTDGDRRSVIVNMVPLREGGTTTGIIISLRDVTDERRARDAVAKSEARYRNLFESASDAIYTLDPQASLTSVNAATCAMLGLPREQLLGRPVKDFLEPEDAERVNAHFLAALQGRPQRYECHLRSTGSPRVLLSVINSPVRAGDTIIGVLGIARDVTEQKKAAEEREILRKQLTQSQKLEAIGQLVSGVAHELNNPLAAVLAYTQLLLGSGSLLGDERESLETIHRETKRAARIVTNLLTFARQHQPERTIVDINQILLDMAELRRYALKIQSISLDVVLDDRMPLTWADPFQLQQVFLNLLANAEQALRSTEGRRGMVVRSSFDGKWIRVSVADTGMGIEPNAMAQIFNPFYTTKPVGEGTGLGLSISDGIVREHGGRIVVESELGVGSTFVVELPFADPVIHVAALAPGGQAA
jgi:two-component system, NtrC family, sensor kinase